ncbi:MAG: PAS domain S-box protein, partial [Desulfuromonadaceae bacterium]|nr:PAS domain S-box protein [Desulfuromonadaceae bacterium]
MAEDDGVSARYLKQSLARMGYEITGMIQAGEEVIESVAENQPDLIIMDITLGGKVDGITAAQNVLTRFGIPVIYVTGNTDIDIFERAKLTEPYAYLIKPYELGQLQNTIELALFKHTFESRLKESETRYRTIFDVSDNAMMLIDSNSIITMINEQFANMLGCSKESVEHKMNWTDFFTDSDRIRLENELQQVRGETGGTPGRFETTLVDRTGRTRIVYTNVKKFPGSSTCIVSMNDVSELKQAEAEIRALNDRLNKTNEGLNEEITLRERIEKQLRYKATHDYLTGLPNRVLFFDRLKQAIAFEERHNTLISLMVL